MYSILYVVEDEPPVIVPVEESITAPSIGVSAKANEPPWIPVILAVAPSHVAVNSNDESLGSPKFILISSETIQSSSYTSTVYIPVSGDVMFKKGSFIARDWPSKYHSYEAVSDSYWLLISTGKTSLHNSITSSSIIIVVPSSSYSTTESILNGGSSTVIIISSSTTIGFPVHVV